MNLFFKLGLPAIFCTALSIQSARSQHLDTSLNINIRVNSLISQMTLAEKISQLGNKSIAIPRLGVKAYNYWVEGLHGVARQGLATSFPQPMGLSATWDTILIYDIAKIISDEARVKNNTSGIGLTYWCPVVNMARDPRWGRSEENLGEDVYLASRMAVNYIKGMQGENQRYLKTVATAKHFACNNIEKNRTRISSDVDERSLREYFLPTFKACITEGKAYSIMSSYNALNGVPSPVNRTLLTNILRNEWGFKGFVVSDCDAVSDVSVNHKFVPTLTDATALSIHNGNDLNCGSTFPNNATNAISKGLLTETELDTALRRIFKARFLLGEFDPPSAVPYTSIPNSLLDCATHRDLAVLAAQKAIVLLKNQNSMLPLKKDSFQTIAIIGPNANAVQLGDYSGTPSVSVSPLLAIGSKLGIDVSFGIIEAENFASKTGGLKSESCGEGGSDLGYITNGCNVGYDSINFEEGTNKMDIRIASASSGGNIQVLLDSLNGKLVGTITATGTGGWQTYTTLSINTSDISGKHKVYLKFTGPSGYLFNINWFRFYNVNSAASIQNRIFSNPGNSKIIKYAFGCSVNGTIYQNELDTAVDYAKKSDLVVLVCGTDMATGGESHDRTTISSPGAQEQLIKAVRRANPKTILVLVNSFSLEVNWAQDSIPAILTAWFGGQAQGTAIADVLFGNYNPGGKLSTTWFRSLSDLPAMNDYNIRNNGTYMYFKGTPLYPFGHGLSYTNFTYSNLKLSSTILSPGETVTISADITNTGDVSGDEVPQLYVHVKGSSFVRPIKELKGFNRINIEPGITKKISFNLKHEDLQYYDVASKTFKVESGEVDIYLGSSSADIRLDSTIDVSGGTVSSTYRQNPFAITEAENFENKSATIINKTCTEGGLCIDSLVNNGYVVYKNFDFTKEALQFNARISCIDANRSINIILDSINGEIAGTLNILSTSNINTFQTQSCLLSGVTGVRNIFLIFKGGTANGCRLNWFNFQENTGTEVKVPRQSRNYKFSIFPNPANFAFNAAYEVIDISDIRIDICSMQGIVLRSFIQKNQRGQHQLEIKPDLSPGTYIVSFKSNEFKKSQLLNVVK